MVQRQRLGPRIIPHFREIVTECVSVLHEGLQGTTNVICSYGLCLRLSSGALMLDDSLSVLQGLLASIPTFWGNGEVTQIIKLHVDLSSSSRSEPMVNLTKLLAKKAPAKVLLPALCTLWPDVSPQTVRHASLDRSRGL
jgi:U3 small nucleolar RNA-associated protein 10